MAITPGNLNALFDRDIEAERQRYRADGWAEWEIIDLLGPEPARTQSSQTATPICEPETVSQNTHSWDDFGNADRLIDRYGNIITWITDTGQWAVYSNGKWTLRGAESRMWTHARRTVEAMEAETGNYDSESDGSEPSEAERFRTFIRRSRSRKAMTDMLGVAQANPRVHATMNDFDNNPHMLNLANGVYNLDTGLLAHHHPDFRLMQQSTASYDPTATSPLWDAFLARVMPDQARRDYLARVMGYTLTGSTAEECIFIHHGTGANGKSVFIKVAMALLGDYAQAVPASTLMAKKGDGIPNDVARMAGKRLLSTVETGVGKKLDEELVKQLTSGDTMSARYLRAEFFDFTPTGKIHMATNHLPHIGSGYGTARRLHDIGWEVTIPEHDRDHHLAEKLLGELPGILNWALRGYADWRLQGLSVPDAVRQKTAEHVASGDLLGMFLDDYTNSHPTADVRTMELYDRYRMYAERAGTKPMTLTSFSPAIRERGYETFKDSATRQSHVRGLYLRQM